MNLSPGSKPNFGSSSVSIDLQENSVYNLTWIDTETGVLIDEQSLISNVNGTVTFSVPSNLSSKFGDVAFVLELDCSMNSWQHINFSSKNVNSLKNIVVSDN